MTSTVRMVRRPADGRGLSPAARANLEDLLSGSEPVKDDPDDVDATVMASKAVDATADEARPPVERFFLGGAAILRGHGNGDSGGL